MDNAERFERNLARWSVFSPEGAAIVSDTSCDHVFFSFLPDGRSNLVGNDDQGGSFLYHSAEDPEGEAKSWFSDLPLEGINVIYVYGVGLGYAYYAARPWLRADEAHSLVFLEDNPQVIHRLLETETGTILLDDPQVSLFFFSEQLFPEKPGDKITSLGGILMPFSLYAFIVAALPSYERSKTQHLAEIKALINYFTIIHKTATLEYSNSGVGFFNNFFRNYLMLPGGYLADHMFGKFQGVPAIICGAGPSLDKNVDLLSKLHDRALIFAGGTAMNALNAHGILPHFGVGIDPNSAQFSRIIMNHAYETPFLYRNRMQYEALSLVHGDRLCVGGSCGYEIANWFQRQLAIEESSIEEGNNVLNFSLSIAHAMGCSPILLTGIDLAYSQERSYASGIISHPIHDRKMDFRTKTTADAVLIKKDIYGNPVQTLWKWVGEALWYSRFAQEHPGVHIINATEGGIGFSDIPNMTLDQAADLYLTNHFDLESWIHGEIQNSALPKEATLSKIKEKMRELAEGLRNCAQRYQKLEGLELQIKDTASEHCDAVLQKICEEEKGLAEETSYKVLLKAIDDACCRFYGLALHRLKWEESRIPRHEALVKKMELDLKRYASLRETASFNALLIDSILRENDELLADAYKSRPGRQHLLPKPAHDEIYCLDGLAITINDPEMHLAYSEILSPDAFCKEQLRYPGGALKYEQCYQGAVLHGPSTYYGENGIIFSRCWFINGQRQGKMWTCYISGQLHSLQRFRAGERHGIQEYYYPNGLLKTIMPYENGKLHGEVLLYHPNGQTARKLRFIEGKRYGTEGIWDERGRLLVESQFLADQPAGTAKKWHANGVLACEITYDDRSQRRCVKMWNPDGSPIDTQERESADYFTYVANQTKKLTDSLGDVVSQLSLMAPVLFEALPKADSPEAPAGQSAPLSDDLTTDLQDLQQKMGELRKLNEAIKEEFSVEGDAETETLWQDAAVIETLQKQLMLHKRKIDSEMGSIEQNFGRVINEVLKRLDQKGGDQNTDGPDKKVRP